jgi:3-hydroxybutyryl-CoA dehydrogenase
MNIQKVGVIGAGIMGHGIAQIAATAGYDVLLYDIEQIRLDKAIENIRFSLSRFIKKKKLTENELNKILKKISITTDLKFTMQDIDFVIEAVPEELELKKKVFAKMDSLAADHTIFATNTSQFRITSIAAATKRPDKILGTHFFNPPVMRRLVEIVRGLDTSDATVETTLTLCKNLNMETVICKKDSAGFITTRLIAILSLEAERIYEEGIGSIEDIDKACRLAFGHPMGPFETSDFSGLETGLKVRRSLADVYGERYRPTQTRVNLVEAGHLGRKTGRGFYKYEKNRQ